MHQIPFHLAFAQRACQSPLALAFQTPERRWSFEQIDQEANRIANGLTALGVEPGNRVACLTKQMVECTLLTLAAQKIGAVCLPINWRLAPGEVEYIVNHGEACFLMADPEFLPLARSIGAPRLRKLLPTCSDRGDDHLFHWSAGYPDRAPNWQANFDDAALQLYSSGTTGLPKGVVLSHRNLIGVCETVGLAMQYSAEGSVTLNVAPTFHIGGLGFALVALYASGATVTFPDFQPERLFEAFAEHGVTHAFLVPAMIQMLLQAPGLRQVDYSSLRVIGYGAAPISEKVLIDAIEVFQCQFVQVYGLTETTGTVVALMPQDHDPGGERAYLLRAAGRACPGVDLKIVDIASGQELPEGEVGEIWIRSAQNMLGYWRNEEATRAAYPEGREQEGTGWFRSGDAGSIRDGYLFIEDRIKDMIITGGENVYPVEVENVLMKHPSVLDCAVIAVPHEKWGESVKACVVFRPGTWASEQNVIDFCRERLAHYKCPTSVDVMDALPRNASGKLSKIALREPHWKGRARAVN